jgi:hypothetical protein
MEEADETVFWIECPMESEMVKSDFPTDPLVEETESPTIPASQRTPRS